MQALPDYYSILGVSRVASQRAIKRAYRIAALRHHPDNCRSDRRQAEKRFARIAEAYRVLSDPVARRRYDFRWRQYAAAVGDARFKGRTQAPPDMWWDNRDGPGFYHRTERKRDEIRLLVVAASVGLLLAGICFSLLISAMPDLHEPDLSGAQIALRTVVAQGVYLLVVAGAVGGICLTRRTIRKLLDLRYAAELTAAEAETSSD